MIKTIIVDDERNNIDAVKILLKELRDDVEIVGEATSADEAIRLIEQNQPNLDLLLLDVQMPLGDGFSVLQKLRIIDFKIIFITAYDQFAIKAIKFSALDYILKPVDPYELNEALNLFDKERKPESPQVVEKEFKKKITNRSFFDKLAVPTLNEILFIPIQNIVYLKSDSNYTTIVTDDKKQITSSKNLGYYEDMIADHGFFRVHNSYIVNIKKITRFIKGKTGSIELDNGLSLEVSASRKEELLQLLNLS